MKPDQAIIDAARKKAGDTDLASKMDGVVDSYVTACAWDEEKSTKETLTACAMGPLDIQQVEVELKSDGVQCTEVDMLDPAKIKEQEDLIAHAIDVVAAIAATADVEPLP